MKFLLLFLVIILPLNASTTRFISIGFGNFNSNNLNNELEFNLNVGVKDYNSRVFLTLDNLFFTNDSQDIDLTELSLNYDYIYLNYKNLSPYFGTGIGSMSVNIGDSNADNYYKTDELMSANIRTGLLYEINGDFHLNLGIKYLYINHKYIKDTYGAFVNFEYSYKE